MVRAIIQARMGSSRLRGKSLIPIAGKSLLERVITSTKRLPFVDEIQIATTTLPEDEPIIQMAIHFGVKVFRGSALNVLERYAEAASDMHENDTVVRITADNPVNFTEVSSQVYAIHEANRNDYTHIEGLSHVANEFIRVRALIEASKHIALDNFDKEHVTPFFRRHRNLFKVETLPADFGGLRHDLDKFLTIDTGDDLLRFEQLYTELGADFDTNTHKDEVYQWLDNRFHKYSKQAKYSSPVLDFEGTKVGKGLPCYIIAEIGQNHNGDMKIAKQLIDMAVSCGANAVKFQKRDIPSELTKEAFDKPYDNPNSFGRTYGEHRMFLELDEAQHLELKEYANAQGITYFCTPCDVPSVELLERIGCPFYKVASRDLTNIPLLERLAKTGKNVIISTGMADIEDIEDALEALQANPEKVIIMQCTSEYPCKPENVNLRAMATLEQRFGYLVGLSDHTSGVIISAAAATMGAVMVEKHITLNRSMKGTDQPGSLEKAGLEKLIKYIRAIELAMGDGIKEVNPATKAAKEKLARSLTSSVFIPAGTTITESMLCLKSPGTGLKWKQRSLIVGKKAKADIPPDVTIFENMVG
jgi:sialic acid synthase